MAPGGSWPQGHQPLRALLSTPQVVRVEVWVQSLVCRAHQLEGVKWKRMGAARQGGQRETTRPPCCFPTPPSTQ